MTEENNYQLNKGAENDLGTKRSNSEKAMDIDLTPYQVRTDLAVEAHQIALDESDEDHIEGVQVDEFDEDDIHVTKVQIETEEAAKRVGKLQGHYLTIDAPGLRRKDGDLQDKVATLLANQFDQFLRDVGIPDDAKCLVVGLGNWNVTPDALGPVVVENMLVTNHLFELQPDHVEDGFRAVSAVSPGVLGTTGMETSDIVYGIVQQTKPNFVIAVDALAASSIERLNTTIQISDTGINPGSGIGNKRKGLNKETLGVPVLAIGVPTVVDAVSIVSDSIDYVMGHLGQGMKDKQEGSNARKSLVPSGMNYAFQKPERFDPLTIPDEKTRQMIMGMIGTLEEQEKRQLIHEVLQPLGHHLIVTPKEVDDFIEDMGNIIANGMNAALHEKVDMSNVSAYTH